MDLVPICRIAKRIIAADGLRGLVVELRRLPLRITAHAGGGYGRWIAAYDTVTPDDIAVMRRITLTLPKRPLISVVMPVYNTPERPLREAIESVRAQTYGHWELCIADDHSTDIHVRRVLSEYMKADHRIKVINRAENGHISRASNSALQIVAGEWIALLDHDDRLAPHALFCVADALNRHPKAKLIYSDEDKIGRDGKRRDPYFKCDWNPDLFLSHNLIAHLAVYRSDIVHDIGGFRVGFEGAQDYDLALRYVERLEASEIHHIPQVLYHWRMLSGSTSIQADEKPYAMAAGARALNEYLQRKGLRTKADYVNVGYRVRYELPQSVPNVTIIIPTHNGCDLLQRCVSSILTRTTYSNYEILIIDNGSDDSDTPCYLNELRKLKNVKIMRDERPFNYSALNNSAVAVASGSIVALVNNDIKVISSDWLGEMVSLALQPGVGAVGARLWYRDDRIQHAGVIVGLGGVAGHAHKFLRRGLPGHFHRANLLQSFSVVTAACLVVRKNVYLEVGGLNERDLAIAFNDIDFCLKLREAGYRNVWSPYAELYHDESASRGTENTPQKRARFASEVHYMRKRWAKRLDCDPAYSPNLSLDREDFSLAFPPRAEKPWRAAGYC